MSLAEATTFGTVVDMSKLIAIIDDEAAIADAVSKRLSTEGFATAVAYDGQAGLELCLDLAPDLVVLDLMLPGLDGLEVCRRLQRERRIPVIMLTAKDDEANVLEGLDLGADDYITKPFSPRELVARVRSVLRRVEAASQAVGGGGRPSGDTVRLGAIELETATRLVRVDGVDVHLTPLEFDLTVCLARERGAVLSRDELLSRVWGYDGDYGARTVDSHVRAVRRKLGDDVIRTVHAVGYAIGLTP